jgi:hypothetical protein
MCFVGNLQSQASCHDYYFHYESCVPVEVDGNKPFLCWIVIQFIAALSLQIAEYKIYKFFYKKNKMWKHLHGDWSQIPAKRTNTKPTAWLQIPARPHHRRHHSLICISCYQSRHRQNLISISFSRITRTAHSYSQAWRTSAIILGVKAKYKPSVTRPTVGNFSRWW